MALSGSIYRNVGSNHRLSIEWTAEQDLNNNTSTITARMYWESLNSYGTINSGATKSGVIHIDGTDYPFSGSGLAGLSGKQKKLIATRSKTVTHNAEGERTFVLDGYFDVEISLSGSYYGRIDLTSQVFTLDPIPRSSGITTAPNWTAGSDRTITVSKASSSFSHSVEIYVKDTLGVFRWVKTLSYSTSEASKSTAFNVDENSLIFRCINGRVSTDTRIIVKTYNGSSLVGTNTYEGTVTAPEPSTVSGDTDRYRYVDEGFDIGISRNNSQFHHSITIRVGNFSATATNVDTQYKFEWTEAQMQDIYRQMPSATQMAGQIDISTYYNGEKVRNTTSIACAFYVRNSLPTMGTGFVYRDTSTITTGITKNNQYIIQGASDLFVEIPVSARAQATNGAWISHYEVTVEGNTKRANYSDSEPIVLNFGKVYTSANTSVVVKAVDSRGFSASASKTILVIPYSRPSVTVTATRNNGFETSTTLKVSGKISPLVVNGTDMNSISSATYEFKKSTLLSYNTPQNLTISGKPNFTASNVSLTLDNTLAWDVRVIVKDVLGTTTVIRRVGIGQPILFVDSDKKSIGVNKFPEKNNSFEVAGTFEADSIQTMAVKGLNGDPMVQDIGGTTIIKASSTSGGAIWLGFGNTDRISLDAPMYNTLGDTKVLDTDGTVTAKTLRTVNSKLQNGHNLATVRDGVSVHNEPMLIQNVLDTISITSNVAFKDIQFPIGFSTTPTWVLAMAAGSNSSAYMATILSWTATSCRVYIRHIYGESHSLGIQVQVVACGKRV